VDHESTPLSLCLKEMKNYWNLLDSELYIKTTMKNSRGTQAKLMNNREDMVLLNKIKRGEIDLYNQIIKKYEKALFVMIVNIIKHRETAEDIAQDVFLSAYTRLGTFDPALAKFSTWLFQIARNRCFNEIKKRKEAMVPDMDTHPSGHNPANDLMKKELFSELDQALDKLPFNQKTAFILAEIQEFSLLEVSEIEEVPVGTIKSRLSRAKEKLRSLLNESMGQT
jgi:RNA polymerase sigma-70 factor, ECF subfamily